MKRIQFYSLLLSAFTSVTTSFAFVGAPFLSRNIKWATDDTANDAATRLKMGFNNPEFFRRKEVSGHVGELLDDTDDGFVEIGCFPVEGQGAIGIKFVVEEKTEEVQFRFDPKEDCNDESHPILHSISNKDGWVVRDLVTNEVLATAANDRGLPLLNTGRNETFWMSFDKENMILRGGTGYMITALQLFEKNYTVPADIKDSKMRAEILQELRDLYTKKFGKLQRYSIYKPGSVMKNGKYVRYPSKYPVYKDLPPLVKAHEDITLEDLDTGSAISIKELSPECQRLYENVAGASIRIDPPDFPDFAQAIDYSINFGFCKKRLKEKAQDEFTSGSDEYDANETYLRITLGSNVGDSPGIPYVMEIWPPGKYSPIHDHSQANAIIKVLHGSLTTRWFESLDRVQQDKNCNRPLAPYAQAVVSKGDVTWLDDRQFQTHQLFNHNIDGTACVTIQCYIYNDSDNRHYENFDYIGGDNNVEPFVPNSDWDYLEFKSKLQKEFSTYKATAEPKPDFKKQNHKKD